MPSMVPQIPGPPMPMPGTLAPNFLPQPGAPGPVPGMPGLPSTAPPIPGAPLPGGPAAPQMNNAPNPMLLMALLQHAAQMKGKAKPGPGAAGVGGHRGDALSRAATASPSKSGPTGQTAEGPVVPMG